VNIVGNRTLGRLLAARVEATPDEDWLVYEDRAGDVRQYSYAEFQDQVFRAAAVLRGLGLRPGDKLTLHLANCPEFLFLWFAAAAIGAVIVPVNVLSSLDELDYLVNHSESVLFATEPSGLGLAGQLRERCAALRQVLVCRSPHDAGGALSFDHVLAQVAAQPPGHRPEAADEVAILYTSGTTSKPKGCLITHANYLHVGESVAKGMRLGSADRFLTVLPLFHGNAQYYSFMSALVCGGSVALMERFSASRYWEQAGRHGATVSSLFAAPMRMLLNQPCRPEDRQHRLRLVIFAQNLLAEQLDEWDARFGSALVPSDGWARGADGALRRTQLLQIYGMTEQLAHPLSNPLDYPRDNMTIGWPSLGWQVRIVDEAGRDVSEGETGQLLVRGESGVSLMKGYFKNPEATAEAIRDGWLWTGDNVRLGPDGFVSFVDRAKDMIKRAGENVAAGEVEAVLKEHPAVFDAAVIGIPDPIRDEAIKACVILREDAAASERDLIDWCAARLARFRVPEVVQFYAELPRTSVGKIQKHILRAEHRGD
jgi:carnitine-CoA ligase